MSYILDALKKSEKERQIGQVPMLSSVEVGEPTHVSKSFPILLVTIILLLLVVVALLYFQPRKVETEMLMESVVVREEPVEINAAPISIKEQTPAEKITEPQDIIEVMKQEQVRKQQAKRERVLAQIKTEVMPEQSSGELLKEGEILITPTSRRETAEASNDPSVSLLSETEYDFQTQLPDMHLDVHVYKDRSEDRFVLINMDKYREGQKMSNGTVIEAIVVDGVMMNYQGKRFLLPLN